MGLVILDRDGVLNTCEPGKFVNKQDELILAPGAMRACALIQMAGHKLALATNQAGVGRGYLKQSMLDLIHLRLRQGLARDGATLDVIHACTFVSDEHEDRKPNPGMLLKGMRHCKAEPEDTIMVGDQDKDILAGQRAEVLSTVQIDPERERGTTLDTPPSLVARDLLDATEFILYGLDPQPRLDEKISVLGKGADWWPHTEGTAFLEAHCNAFVFTNGVFDILHYGHLRFLQVASGYDMPLVVGVNSDRSAHRVKGKGKPRIPAMWRARSIAALPFVSHVVIFSEDSPHAFMDSYQPRLYVKGGDYGLEQLDQEYASLTHRPAIRVLPFFGGVSTTKLLADLPQAQRWPKA
jgi:rfaE bifunctional protein nucleotidyltransferase chain/domain